MPKGPKGQKRPADVVSNAVKVMKIATGEEEEEFDPDDGKDKAAQAMGRKGGKARAESLSAKKRSEIAKKAAAKRWQR
ncbi:MAG: RNA-binding protein [Alphaproteobacteria bacterium]|nr:RNA-binding protein [Alphaproteobacteria bacterium]